MLLRFILGSAGAVFVFDIPLLFPSRPFFPAQLILKNEHQNPLLQSSYNSVFSTSFTLYSYIPYPQFYPLSVLLFPSFIRFTSLPFSLTVLFVLSRAFSPPTKQTLIMHSGTAAHTFTNSTVYLPTQT